MARIHCGHSFLDRFDRPRARGARDAQAAVIVSRAFAGRRYAVLGLARSGLATVEALVASGAGVTAWDAREVGRASGRERLCQYGSIPVCAVSFIQQTNSHTE